VVRGYDDRSIVLEKIEPCHAGFARQPGSDHDDVCLSGILESGTAGSIRVTPLRRQGMIDIHSPAKTEAFVHVIEKNFTEASSGYGCSTR
jgi:hypothetical protein